MNSDLYHDCGHRSRNTDKWKRVVELKQPMNPDLKKALAKFKRPFIYDQTGFVKDSNGYAIASPYSKRGNINDTYKDWAEIGNAIAEFLNSIMEDEG